MPAGSSGSPGSQRRGRSAARDRRRAAPCPSGPGTESRRAGAPGPASTGARSRTTPGTAAGALPQPGRRATARGRPGGRGGRQALCDPACVPDDELLGPTDWGARVGVGPWRGPWPDAPRYDPELLAHGDRRNVVDGYRYWTVEAIVADLDRRRHPFHVAIENFQHDHNIGTVVRTANAFAAAEVHIVGRRRWNRRGAMVPDPYQPLRPHDDVSGLVTYAAERGLAVVAVDNTPGSQPVETAD